MSRKGLTRSLGRKDFVGIPPGSCKRRIVEVVRIIIFMLRQPKKDTENLALVS